MIILVLRVYKNKANNWILQSYNNIANSWILQVCEQIIILILHVYKNTANCLILQVYKNSCIVDIKINAWSHFFVILPINLIFIW